MEIVEFFDPGNPQHLEALQFYNNQGGWPKNFLPENIIFENHWFPRLEGKIIVYELQKELGKIDGKYLLQSREEG